MIYPHNQISREKIKMITIPEDSEYLGTFHDENANPVRVFWGLVTPRLASEWLELNTVNNRNINDVEVENIAADITEGFWLFNGATVAFSRDDELMDAQHRCHAVVESGGSVRMLILHGLDPAAMLLMGQDRPRSTRDLLKTSGRIIINDSAVCAIASLVVACDKDLRNQIRTRSHMADYVWENRKVYEPIASWSKSITKTSDLFIAPTHRLANGKNTRRAISDSALGTIYHIMVETQGADPETVKTFWNDVAQGMSTYPEAKAYINVIRHYIRMTAPLLGEGGKGRHVGILHNFDTMIRTYNRWATDDFSTRIVSRPATTKIIEIGHLTLPVVKDEPEKPIAQ